MDRLAERFRWPIVAAMTAAYAASFPFLYADWGPQVGALAFLPAVFGGFLVGRRAAVAVGLFLSFIQAVLFQAFTIGSFESWARTGLIATATILLMSIGAGVFGDMHRALRQQKALLKAEIDAKEASLDHLARFHHLLDQSSDAILCIDPGTGLIVDANATATTLFVDSAPGLVGQSAADIPGLLPSGVGLRALLDELDAEASLTVDTVLRRDGSGSKHLETHLKRTDVRGTAYILAVSRDVSQRVEAEKSRHDAVARQAEVEQLRSTNAFKAQFLNIAAHELNTPLTPLVLQLDLLRSARFGPLSPQQNNAVIVIERNIERLALLVKDMLEAARLQSGRLRLDRQDTDIVAVVNDMMEAFGPAADKAGVHLRLDAPGDVTVDADPRRVSHVLSNLISNAIKFTHQGGTITTHIEPVPDGVTVHVADDGSGLTAEQIGRLFQPFTQVHDTSDSIHGGTGLGLYISKGIVEQHGGWIRCESEGPGRGTCFTFFLPYVAAPQAPPEETDTQPAELAPDPLARNP